MGTDWSDASTSQGLLAPALLAPAEAGREAGNISPSEPPDRTDPADTVTSEFRSTAVPP